jgi:hypothetical protein
MSESTLWRVVAGLCASPEPLTVSFYSPMLTLGAAAAAVVALRGGDPAAQMTVAATVGGGPVMRWHRKLLRRLYAVLCGKRRSHFAEAGVNG